MFRDLNENKVFKFFSEISNIPRESGQEEKIANYLEEFGKSRNFNVIRDEYNNVIIKKFYSDKVDSIALQAHTDMVCVSREEFDFTNNPISLERDGDILRAKGTTLGADNGIGVAMMLSILDEDLEGMPNLECIFTADEERGMTGVINLKEENINSKYLINIDTEEDYRIINGCAGGYHVKCEIPVNYTIKKGSLYRITISELKSGHSGCEIGEERGNAIKLLARTLNYLRPRVDYEIYSIKSGDKTNVIPGEGYVDIIINEKDLDIVSYALINFTDILQKEYEKSDPAVMLWGELLENEKEYKVLDKESKKNVRFYLLEMPNGVRKMSKIVPGEVQTSLNVGIINMDENSLITEHLIRSSIETEMKALVESLGILAEYMGGFITIDSNYSPWEVVEVSNLIECGKNTYKEVFNKECSVETIHAGLECGILSEKLRGVEMISIGPNINNAHTVNEWVSISSTNNIYKFLVKLLQVLNK